MEPDVSDWFTKITPEKIKEMKAFLKKHPVNPEYDDVFDGNIPTDDFTASCYDGILRILGELD